MTRVQPMSPSHTASPEETPEDLANSKSNGHQRRQTGLLRSSESSRNTKSGFRNVPVFGLAGRGLAGWGLPPIRDVTPTDR